MADTRFSCVLFCGVLVAFVCLFVVGWFLLLFDFFHCCGFVFDLVWYGFFVLFNLSEALQEEGFLLFGIILNGGTTDFGDKLVQLVHQAVCSTSLSGCRCRGAVGQSRGRLVQAPDETKPV